MNKADNRMKYYNNRMNYLYSVVRAYHMAEFSKTKSLHLLKFMESIGWRLLRIDKQYFGYYVTNKHIYVKGDEVITVEKQGTSPTSKILFKFED